MLNFTVLILEPEKNAADLKMRNSVIWKDKRNQTGEDFMVTLDRSSSDLLRVWFIATISLIRPICRSSRERPLLCLLYLLIASDNGGQSDLTMRSLSIVIEI